MKFGYSLTAAAAAAFLACGVNAADLTADVVVIGAGASGSAAALAAQQAGANVVLLEKTAFPLSPLAATCCISSRFWSWAFPMPVR